MDKRSFLRGTAAAALGLAAAPDRWAIAAAAPPTDSGPVVAGDAWARIRADFRLDPAFVNLENGYYCFQPQPVLEAFETNVRRVNFEASRYMRTHREDDRIVLRGRLAALAGCSAEELIVTRNATEALDTVINGFDWRRGDEAVMSNQDYGAMLDMFRLQARRHGMVNRLVDIPQDPASDQEVVDVYAAALSPRTRLLMIPHMVNITGHVLPVRALCAMAQARGVQVMVDGAHTFAQLDFKVPDLGCDYYAASLHKWLSSPLGAGLLYVRRDRVADLWPIFGDDTFPRDDIRRLNHVGTHPAHTDLTIGAAIDYHERIGGAAKEARLRSLQRYWTSRVRDVPRIRLQTPRDPARSCGIANVGIGGIAPAELARRLFEEFRIYTVAIDGAGVQGVRVTPQVYTTFSELDQLVAALRTIAAA
jgi:selenocysteine lyase/cysteine desulfurase